MEAKNEAVLLEAWRALISGVSCTAGLVSSDDTVGVVGSSHSAVLVLMNLLEMQDGPKVVNLYRSPLKYAKFLADGTIVLDNTGLKVSKNPQLTCQGTSHACILCIVAPYGIGHMAYSEYPVVYSVFLAKIGRF